MVRTTIWLCLAAAASTLTSAMALGEPTPAYKQADLPIDRRIDDLLARMTLEEKVMQLQSNSSLAVDLGLPVGPNPAAGVVVNGRIDETVARRVLKDGLGAFTIATFDPSAPGGMVTAVTMRTQADLIQAWVVGNTRLGIPILFQGEALHGAMVGGATAYPQATGLGSTWDRALIRQVFTATAREARASGMSMVLAPVLDLARDPRFGRVEEMYSEDPYLVGELGREAVLGLQGTGPAIDGSHVIAVAKHFVHGDPQNGTNTAPNDVSERTMRSIFFPPFDKAIRDARVSVVMPSYNENSGGIPSHVNRWLLQDVLRSEWGFKGVVSSDWFAVTQLRANHRVVASDADAGVAAFNTGVDMELPNAVGFVALADAVRAGRIAQRDLDAAVRRVLTLKFRAGLFEHPYSDAKLAPGSLGSPAAVGLARRAADEAIVLLKNDRQLLPLDPKAICHVAVIGPNAAVPRLGGYSGVPPHYVSVVDGVRSRLGSKAIVTYAEGVRISEPDVSPVVNKLLPYKAPSIERDTALIAEAVETARKADVVVVVLGDNETVTREAFAGATQATSLLGDTDTLDLPGRQDLLVRELAKLGKPMVAVLLTGRAHSIVELSGTAPAILQGWYLGQETGHAVAGVLFGDVNPSGKLPVTMPRSAGQLPVYYKRTPQARLGYVFNDNSPLYPFGHGLSYTTFRYARPTIDRATIPTTGRATVSVAVTNTGARAGDEIVQLYVHPRVSSVVQPVIRLAGFERVTLKPNETRTIDFAIGAEQLAIWDRWMKHVVEPGTFELSVGPSSASLQSVELAVQP